MIKTALKHFIYEICINTVFENITNNFMFVLVDNIPKYIMDLYIEAFEIFDDERTSRRGLRDTTNFLNRFNDVDIYVRNAYHGVVKVDWEHQEMKSKLYALEQVVAFENYEYEDTIDD